MPHVSRYKLKGKTEQQLTESLEFVLTEISNIDDMHSFLLSLLTPTEQVMLAKRLAIIVLLKERLPESHIALALNVTRITVSRMHLFLEARGDGYNIALKILEDKKRMKELKEDLLKLASYAVRAAGGRVKPSII